jgi:TolB protein
MPGPPRYGETRMNRRIASLIPFALALAALAAVALPALGQSPSVAGEEEELPDRSVVIDIDSPERSLYKIAVPNLQGSARLGPQAASVLRNDFELVSLFEILDARSFVANLEEEGLGIEPDAWSTVGAQGVIKGQISGSTVKMRFYEIAKGDSPSLERSYRGTRGLRNHMHDFANRVVKILTGTEGAFGTRLTYARRIGRGRKDVYVADFDGHGVGRVSSGKGIAMLPSFGPGGIWYSKLTEMGMYITRTGVGERPIIKGDGLNMGASACNGRIYFTSSRDGNSEIYSAQPDGSGVRRLTRHPAIDVSPKCGPGGQIAFVSNRHGGPQIFVMGGDGSGVRRVTFKGNHNQTPAWCPDPDKPLIAFTGISGGTDVFTVNIKTQEYTRLTQGQGVNKDPAFSPDCRMVAFWSSRGGVFVSNPEGLNQNKVISGHAETIRWSR